MTDLNHVTIVGNLTKDPELRHTPGGTAVCQMRVASNTRRKDSATGEWGDKPNYFDVIVWGNQGENAAKWLSKGKKVGISGRLDWREWETKEGSKRQTVEIVAEQVQFLSPRENGGSGSSGGDYRSTAGEEESFAGASDDDIPF